MELKTDTEIIDWLATQGIISGSFNITDNADQDGLSIDYYALEKNITVAQAFREVLTLAINYETENPDIFKLADPVNTDEFGE